MANDTMKANHASAAELYQERGFQHRIGYGTRPALLNIDLANAWTRKGSPFNLFDIDAKFGDVEPVEAVLRYLREVAPFTR